MFLKRKDGSDMTLSEQRMIIEEFSSLISPVPYTNEDLMSFNPDGSLTLGFHRVDPTGDTEYEVTFFIDTTERLERGDYIDAMGDDKVNKRWEILIKLCENREDSLKSEINKRLGGDQDALDSVTWYNGLAEYVVKWKQEALVTTEAEYKLSEYEFFNVDTTTYGAEEPDDRVFYQLQVLWMIAVDKFGDYGTSPRTGWIENIPLFVLWCDEITQTYKYDIGSIEYINKQEEKKND